MNLPQQLMARGLAKLQHYFRRLPEAGSLQKTGVWRRRAAAAVTAWGLMTGGFQPLPPARAITITMSYSTDFTGDESPSWDPNGTILKQHFAVAKQIWEALLPGPGSYEFDFQWDDDISGLGLTTDLQPVDTWIEINPNRSWFADPTPGDSVEFDTFAQTLFQDLDSSDQATFFPGTAPPGTLEVGARRGVNSATLVPSASGQSGINQTNGFDLLSTVVHEMGHVLGIGADALGEPGEFNIDPQHVNGLTDVLVLEDDDSGHLAGDGLIPFLMCEGCGAMGVRRLPTATDVLVIAEDQGISNVRLQRVGSTSSGLSSSTNRWIGGAVPNSSQDVYISHGGTLTLDANLASKDFRIDSGNSVDTQGNLLSSQGTLWLNGGSLNVPAGGKVVADVINLDSGNMTTSAGSLVRFNTLLDPGAITANFNGSVSVGFDNPTPPPIMDPTQYSTWNIGEEFRVGDVSSSATFVIDFGMTINSGSGRIGTDFNGNGSGHVIIDGGSSSWSMTGPMDARSGTLNISNGGLMQSGDVSIGEDEGDMIAGVFDFTSLWEVNGKLDIGPNSLVGNGSGRLIVQDDARMTVTDEVYIHGTPSKPSDLWVQSGGEFETDKSITLGPNGELHFTGGEISAKSLIPFLGSFSWTGGKLELNDHSVRLDSSMVPSPLPANTVMSGDMQLILNGLGRDLTIGETAVGLLDMGGSARVEVNNGDVFVAKLAGSNGTLELNGPGTSMLVNGSMAIGGTQAGPGGTGHMHLEGDLTVTDTLTYWSTGSMLVDSTGVMSADVLRRGGGGGLNVGPGGHVRFNELQGFGSHISMGGISAVGIAEGDTGQGALQRGSGEDYSFREGFIVGDNAPAQVDLINGGTAGGDGFVHLGNRPGSSGSVLNVSGVDGFGSPATLLQIPKSSNEKLIVGVWSPATMNVTDRGKVYSGSAIVAERSASGGSSAWVSGGGSDWQVGGSLTVGGDAIGALTVDQKGHFSVEQSLFIGGAPKEEGGPGSGGGSGPSNPSLVWINGPNSMGEVQQNTVVGHYYSGQLKVDDRAELHTQRNGYVGYDSTAGGSSARMSTRGAWSVGRDLHVGYGAKADLQIQSEGNVRVGTPSLPGGNATIGTLAGADGSVVEVSDTGQWNILHDLTVGNLSQADMQIASKGMVKVGGNAWVGRNSTAGGSQTQVSSSGLWDIAGDLRVGEHTDGSLLVDSLGQTLVGGNAFLGAGSAAGVGQITLVGEDASIPTMAVSGDLFVGGDQLSGMGRGKVLMEGRTRVEANRVVNWEQGEIQLAGILDVGTNHVENRGHFTGEGLVLGELQNFGEISPGLQGIGGMEVTGDFLQGTGASMLFELAGATFDRLYLDGNATIADGELSVALLDGFFPSLGDQFELLVYGGTVGGAGFSGFDLPEIGPHLAWETANLLTTGVLEVVAALPGDFDFDGDVDGNDFLDWQRGNSYSTLSDNDLAAWEANYGNSLAPVMSPVSAVPEPATFLLMTAGILGIAAMRCTSKRNDR